jgi:hypothetical protein
MHSQSTEETLKLRTHLGLAFIVLLLSSATVEGAGITAFLQSATPEARGGIGFAFGIPLITEIITLEGEYSRASEKGESPSLTIWSGSVLLISPIEIIRLRPYFATGFGLYRQAIGPASETSFATLPGFGVFLRLGGPLHGRVDYRVVKLRGEPLQGEQRRFYAGLTIRF